MSGRRVWSLALLSLISQAKKTSSESVWEFILDILLGLHLPALFSYVVQAE